MSNLIEKVPPQSLEAEISVLGAILLDANCIYDAVIFLKTDYFYVEKHRIIFNAILELFNKNEPVDLMMIREALKSSGQLDSVGGSVYLSSLVNSVATADNLKYYAGIVKEKFELRQLISISHKISDSAFNVCGESESIIEEAEREILNIVLDTPGEGLVKVSDSVDAVFEVIDAQVNENKLQGFSTGFCDLDDITQGLHKTELTICAARPGIGKTSFALDLAMNMAGSGLYVNFFSAEMSKELLIRRAIFSKAQVDSRNTYQFKAEFHKLTAATEEVRALSLWIDDTQNPTTTQIKAKATRNKIKGKCDIIFIDYLGYIKLSDAWRGMSANKYLEAVTNNLKNMAADLDVPVFCLCQLNRNVESRNPPIPILADLRDSGAIEQDAATVMFIYRPEYYLKDKTPQEKRGLAEIIIAKQRNGPTGTIKMTFIDKYTQFRNWTPIEAPENYQERGE